MHYLHIIPHCVWLENISRITDQSEGSREMKLLYTNIARVTSAPLTLTLTLTDSLFEVPFVPNIKTLY